MLYAKILVYFQADFLPIFEGILAKLAEKIGEKDAKKNQKIGVHDQWDRFMLNPKKEA